MSVLLERAKRFVAGWIGAWDQFWFRPADPIILSILRIGCGIFLLYSHLVLATDLMAWIGPDAWIDPDLSAALQDGTYAPATASWTYLWDVKSPMLLWLHHAIVILVTGMFTVGLWTRLTAPLSLFFQWMILHRLVGSLFGFDQIVTYMTMYLAISPCGARYSIDAWRRRKSESGDSPRLSSPETTSVSANVATRLLQIHLCVIYLFGGLAKARGESWWDGTAVWYSIANLEYQSFDMTWMADWPMLFSAMSLLTMAWEISYAALVWPRRTRPLVLALAVMVHGGIACFLGMMTFGLAMILANIIFVPARWIVGDDSVTSDPSSSPSSSPRPPKDSEADLQRRRDRLRQNEAKYRERVAKLRRREAKLKEAAERRRRSGNSLPGEDSSSDESSVDQSSGDELSGDDLMGDQD